MRYIPLRAKKLAALTQEAEPPPKLDPVAKIFIFQSQNVEDLNTSKAIEIKIEYPPNSETPGIKPDLDLDVECDSKTVELPNLAIENTVTETESRFKRSARIKIKEEQDQEKILKAIQKNNRRKESKHQEMLKEDQHIRDSVQENQDNVQDMEIEQVNKLIRDIDQEVNQKDQQNLNIFVGNKPLEEQALEITELSQHEQEKSHHEQSEHLEKQNAEENEVEKRKRGRPRKPIDSNITNEQQKYHEVQNENEQQNDQNKEQDTEQYEGLLIERENVHNFERTEVKRRRGRPRKSINVIVPVVTEKRKRGRPPKPKVVNDINYDNTEHVKRKRGRPPKPRNEHGNMIVDIPIAPAEEVVDESDEEYTVYISEEITEDPIHLEIEGVINFLA